MITKVSEITLLKYNNLIKEAMEELKHNKFSFIPILDDSDKYLGVFDKNSLIKMVYDKISIDDKIEKVINKDFPTTLENDIISVIEVIKDSYLIVLDFDGRVVGLFNPLKLKSKNLKSKNFFDFLHDLFFEKFLNSISDGVLICDENLIVRKINKSYTKLTGLSPQDIEGKKVNEIRKGSQIPKSIKSGKVMKNIYRKEGNTEYFVDLYPININNKIHGGIVLAKDITEVQNLTKKLDEYTKKLDEYGNEFSRLKNRINSTHKAKISFDGIIATSDKMKECIEIAKKAAVNDTNIMIRGESGTGKEVFAHAIHNYSNRRDNPFAINSAAIDKFIPK